MDGKYLGILLFSYYKNNVLRTIILFTGGLGAAGMQEPAISEPKAQSVIDMLTSGKLFAFFLSSYYTPQECCNNY